MTGIVPVMQPERPQDRDPKDNRRAQIQKSLQRLTSKFSLASRIALLTTLATTLILGSVSCVLYALVRDELEGSLDESMLRRANAAVASGIIDSGNYNATSQLLQLADVKIAVLVPGRVLEPVGRDPVARALITSTEIGVAGGQTNSSTRSAMLDGDHYRIVAIPVEGRGALVFAQSTESIFVTLDRLAVLLLLTSAVGIAVSGAAGWAVARNGLRPVRRLTAATEQVTRTQQLTPVPVYGQDELARLGTSFNAMLMALDASRSQQSQLVADAGHELKTPLTSLRTNIELLAQMAASSRPIDGTASAEIFSDVQAQIEEMSTLVGDLVELAREEPLPRGPEPGDFAIVVERAIERVRRRSPGATFSVELEPWEFFGEPHLLERAVTNLLDNAVKWSPLDGEIGIRLRAGELSVTDQGPGIAANDLPHVFERFYRSAEARTMPGSGLGLAIAKRAAERHGGSVAVSSVHGSGSEFRMSIPRISERAIVSSQAD